MDIWPLLKLLRSFDLVKWLFEKRLILAPFFTFTSRVIYISDHLTEFPHQNSFLANQEEKKQQDVSSSTEKRVKNVENSLNSSSCC